MYDEHFGLTDRPFQLTPDPRFWFETATHRKAMAYLGYGLAQEGFIVITGDIGAGKTTLVGHLIDTLDEAAVNVVKIVSTAIEADDLLRVVATHFGIDTAALTKAQLLTVIERGLHTVARTGRRTLLIVDEAQGLPVSALEELRMLSNFQAGGRALLQIVLLGQPEFRDRLHGSDRLEQLRQRVIAIHHLDPMAEHEVADYIAHRLSVVGWQGRPDFAADAFEALYHGSDGLPRRLNLLAGRVMLHAAIEDVDLIDARTIRHVLRDLHADLPLMTHDRPPSEAPIALAPEPENVDPDAVSPELHHHGFVPRSARWLVIDPEPELGTKQSGGEPSVEPAFASFAEDRLAALESRIEEQDAALRRVLTLLVDWVESDKAPTAIPDPADHAPIRSPIAWDDAA